MGVFNVQLTLQDVSEFSPNQRAQILQVLKSQQFVPTYVIRNLASQYNARIKELRAGGVPIESCMYELDGKKVWGFRLI